MRLVFCGTPEFAVPILRRLAADPAFRVEAVITQPDRPRGRGLAVTASPVKETALEAGLYVYQPEKIKSESAQDFLNRINPDAIVIIAYGQIVPAQLLEIPPLGWINLHASLLPRYRGAAPINWAIINGETRTGVTTMRIDAGLDTGPILLQREMEIGSDETAPELARRMAEAGPELMVETLRKLDCGEIAPIPQDHSQATLAPLLKKEDGRINWNLTAQRIYNRIRGLEPWPGAYTTFRSQLCHIWGRPATPSAPAASAGAQPGTLVESGGQLFVTCGQGTWLRLESVRSEGRKRVSAREFATGARLAPNERFLS